MFFLSVVAAICSTSASLPQIFANDAHLSYWSMVLRGIGAVLWVIYGVMKLEWALVGGSGVAACIELVLFVRTICAARNES